MRGFSGTPPQQKSLEREKGVCFSLVHVDISGSVQATAKEFVKGWNELTF